LFVCLFVFASISLISVPPPIFFFLFLPFCLFWDFLSLRCKEHDSKCGDHRVAY
jgi:hypothetical protein